MTSNRRHFPPAALTEPGLTPAEIGRLCVVHADPEVNRAARALQIKLKQLVDRSLLGLVAEAIGRNEAPLSRVTPAEVAKHLVDLTADVDAGLAATTEELAAHNRVRLQHSKILWPMREAVATRITAIETESTNLRKRIAAAESDTAAAGRSRYRQLVAIGLSNEQIAAIDPTLSDTSTDDLRARVDALNAEIRPLRAFSFDPFADPEPLAGLGFDDLIAAQRAALGDAQGLRNE